MTTAVDVLRTELGEPVDREWQQECLRWRGVILLGRFAHYCHEWDGLPVDETTPEFECCTCC